MRCLALIVVSALAPAAVAGEGQPSVADLVARLRSLDVTYEDWRPVLDAGRAAVPELKKLLGDTKAREGARVAAAIILYRFGDASALDALSSLLEARDEAARREAAAALAAFTGGPAGGGEALAAWRAWWKTNREKALAAKPLSALHGKLVAIDAAKGLVVLSLSEKHGAKRGMRVNVRRGDDAVCLVEIVMVDAKGSVARIVEHSIRTAPRQGDAAFWLKPQGE